MIGLQARDKLRRSNQRHCFPTYNVHPPILLFLLQQNTSMLKTLANRRSLNNPFSDTNIGKDTIEEVLAKKILTLISQEISRPRNVSNVRCLLLCFEKLTIEKSTFSLFQSPLSLIR